MLMAHTEEVSKLIFLGLDTDSKTYRTVLMTLQGKVKYMYVVTSLKHNCD